MIVLPARNEGPRVGRVVAEVRRILPDVEVIVVENGSVDDTAEAAARAGATVLRSGPGYARALRAGFTHALAAGAPWVVQMDADEQHPAAALPGLLRALEHAARAGNAPPAIAWGGVAALCVVLAVVYGLSARGAASRAAR